MPSLPSLQVTRACHAVPPAARSPQRADSPAAACDCETRHGFSSRSGSGSRLWGAFWYATGRRNREIAAVPTDVLESFVVAGHGPPCCIAGMTATPVGHPLNSNCRPAQRDSIRRRRARSLPLRLGNLRSTRHALCLGQARRWRHVDARFDRRIHVHRQHPFAHRSQRSACCPTAGVGHGVPNG